MMFASHHRAVIMHVAELKMIMLFANVFEIIMEIHMKDVDQNVRAIPIVQQAKLVSEINAKIHASECVASKPFVQYRIIFRFVHAHQERLEMHSDNVWLKNVMYQLMKQEIHAIQHHALSIQFAEVKAMFQFVNVFQATSVIRMELDVIQNV